MDTMSGQVETFEQKIFTFISKCLQNDETIQFDKVFDYYLPKGVKNLKWPKGTYIEIKYTLMYNTFTRIRRYYDDYHLKHLIVIVMDKNDVFLRFECDESGRNIEVITYDDLIKEGNLSEVESISQEAPNVARESSYRDSKDSNIREKAKDALIKDKVSFFLGAGVSASAGVVTWNNLIEQLCIKKGISRIDSDINSVEKGRYIIEKYKNQEKEIPDDFYHDMRSVLYTNYHPSALIAAIAELIMKSDVDSIISYNYDDLVEQEVSKQRACYPVYDKSRPINKNSIHIFHVHGYIPQEGDWSPIILGEREYHKIYQESYNWGNVEQLHALCRSTCFFIGLSMTDPNLRRLIDISLDGSDNDPVHYAFLRRIEYNIPFMETMMRGFGVNCIWYDEHKDLPSIIDSFMK